MTRLLPALGSGYRPTAWCANCGDPYPVESVCPCVLEDEARARIIQFTRELQGAASIRRRTLALLAERYPTRHERTPGWTPLLRPQLDPNAMQIERWRL